MSRLHINYRLGIILWLAGLLALIVIIAGVGVYASLTAPLALLMVFFPIFLPLILLLTIPRTLNQQDRTMHAAGRGDSRVAPLVIAPPNPNDALAPGATLQMTRTTPTGAIVRAGAGWLFLATFMIALTALLAALAFSPALASSVGNGDTSGWVVWFLVLAPLVVWGSFITYQYTILARERHVTITAEDRGITLKQSTRRPQFIPWDDIHVWVRGVGNSSDPYLSSYGLIGYQHRLFLQFNSIFNLRIARAKPFLAVTYSGGSEYYQAQARQLLATIAARGKAPMRTFPQGFYGPGARRVLPFAQLTTTDIAVLPVAHPALLPSLPAVQAMQLHPGPLTLRQRPKFPIALFLIMGILGIIAIANTCIALISNGDLLTAMFNFVPLLLIAALLLVRFRFSLNPSISVDAQGIRGSVLNRQFTIPWQSVRYWVIEPPTGTHPNESIYGIFSDGPTLTWRVPVVMGTDPQSVTRRAYAEAFHAMIAARMGQPPRQLPAR